MSSVTSTTLRSRPLPNRLLFPTLSPDAQLPPLVASPELTAELYDLIALSLRAFVVPWWSKISRYDKQFLPEITRILAVVIHQLDARVQAAPLPDIFLCHVPAIITQHYRDYRNAHHKLGTSYASGAAASLPQLFHQLQPHMAVSADGRLDTEYFRQLIDHILQVCLPPEDYQLNSERFIIREVILKVLLNDVIPKITQPWFIQSSILDLLQIQDQASNLPYILHVQLTYFAFPATTSSPLSITFINRPFFFPGSLGIFSLSNPGCVRYMSCTSPRLQAGTHHHQAREPNTTHSIRPTSY